jgi:hypothetical protein
MYFRIDHEQKVLICGCYLRFIWGMYIKQSAFQFNDTSYLYKGPSEVSLKCGSISTKLRIKM